MFATAVDSFALCLDRSRLGIAIVAISRMIATTISNSSKENPLFFFKIPPNIAGPHSTLMHLSWRGGSP
jgi:hypothetical protein